MVLYVKYIHLSLFCAYFIYHLMHLVIWFPKHTDNEMMIAADKQRQLSFYVGSSSKWQLTDREKEGEKSSKIQAEM